VKFVRLEGDSVLLMYSGGATWVSLDALSDDARKSLGLLTRPQQAAFDAELTSLVPDWRQISSNPEFLKWLKVADAREPASRVSLLYEALKTGNARVVVIMMQSWKTERERQKQAASDIRQSWRVEGEGQRQAALEYAWAEEHPGWNEVNARRMAALAREFGWSLDDFKEALMSGDLSKLVPDGRLSQEEKDTIAEIAEEGLGAGGDPTALTAWRLDPNAGMQEFCDIVQQKRNLQAAHAESDVETADPATQEQNWTLEVRQILNGPDQVVTFIAVDGRFMRKPVRLLTLEERELYRRQYVERKREELRRRGTAQSEAPHEVSQPPVGPHHEVRQQSPFDVLIQNAVENRAVSGIERRRTDERPHLWPTNAPHQNPTRQEAPRLVTPSAASHVSSQTKPATATTNSRPFGR
jgi:hypothetical protein